MLAGINRIFNTGILISAAVIFLITGCNKTNDPDPAKKEVKCFLTKRSSSSSPLGPPEPQQTTWTYNSDNKAVSGELTYSGKTITFIITYDTNGNCWQNESSSGHKNIFMYDGSNRLIKQDDYMGTVLQGRYEYEYNSLNQLVKRQYYWVSSEETVNKGTYYTFEYADITKNYRKKKFYDSDGTFTGSFEFEYDNYKTPHFGQVNQVTGLDTDSNIIKSIYKNSDATHSFTQNVVYQYNDNGYPTLQTSTNLLTNTIYTVEYTYDCK